jgi:phage major head subunit gpT-like protein
MPNVLTPQMLGPIFTNFEMVWQRGFQAPPTYWEKFCTKAPSGTSQNVYPWLGITLDFREWLGERVIQNLETHAYAIVNKEFELTWGVKRSALEDDSYGLYSPAFEQAGWNSKIHPDRLIFGLINSVMANIDAGSPDPSLLGYDGKTFFSAHHPVGLAGATVDVSNVDSGGSGPYWFLIDASRPIRPFVFQERIPYQVTRMDQLTDEAVFMLNMFRFGVRARVNAGFGLWQLAYASNKDLNNPANFEAAIAAMEAIKTDAGAPFGAWSGTTNKFLLVPSTLRGAAKRICNATTLVGVGAGGPTGTIGQAGSVPGVPTDNVWKGECEPIVSQYLKATA